jgi:hypothetical protein
MGILLGSVDDEQDGNRRDVFVPGGRPLDPNRSDEMTPVAGSSGLRVGDDQRLRRSSEWTRSQWRSDAVRS